MSWTIYGRFALNLRQQFLTSSSVELSHRRIKTTLRILENCL